MLKVTNNVLEEIKEGQRTDPELVKQQELINQGRGVDFKVDKDGITRFTSGFWRSLQQALGTQLKWSSAYHPQTDGQTERTIQSLEDLLRACVLDQGGSWDSCLPLIEFTYNNNYHSSIEMAPLRIEDKEMKHLRDKEVITVKVIWGGPTRENAARELESRMKESYPKLFSPGNFRGRKFFKWGRIVTPRFLEYLIIWNFASF
jgi:hypothetical protein